MKLIADLNVNGNQLLDGEKNIGPVVKDNIAPVNPNEIDLAALRSSILNGGETVPVNFTFEEFIEALFVKVNAEIKTKNTQAPKIAVSGALTGTTSNVTVEVGAANATYTLTNTATEGTYTDGKALTHKITMGKEAESESYVAIGCEGGTATFNGDSDTAIKMVHVDMTQYAAGAEAAEESKTMEVGNITITKPYEASTSELSTDAQNKPVFRSSYGEALYTTVGEAIAKGSCTATTTNGKSVTVATKLRNWVKTGDGALGARTITNIVTLAENDVILIPKGYSISVHWTDLGNRADWKADQYTTSTVYIALPHGASFPAAADLKTASSEITEAPYAQYTKYVIGSLFPTLSASHSLTIEVTKNA